MTPEDKTRITQWVKRLKQDIDLELVITDDQRSETIKEFCDFLGKSSTKIKIKKTSESGIPCIRINHIKYQMAPSDRELEPFFKLLSGPDILAQKISLQATENLKKLSFPAILKVYVLPNCTFCPKALEQVLGLAAVCSEIKPIVIDGSLFPDLVEKDKIKSAPTIILDDQFRWSGSLELEEIAGFILNRDPSKLNTSSLRGIIEDGRADHLARMMMESNKIFPEFQKLLIHDKWPVRLGAMVVFETIAEQNSNLTTETIQFLWKKFPQTEDTVKGDILYLFGISGNKNVTSKIESVLNGKYSEDVMEAALEAKEEISILLQPEKPDH